MAARNFTAQCVGTQTLEEKCKRVGFHCVISQPMHVGGWTTCPSKNLTKRGSIPNVNAAHLMMNYIIANNEHNAIDYIIKTYIIANNEIYAIDLLTSSYGCMLSTILWLKSCFGN